MWPTKIHSACSWFYCNLWIAQRLFQQWRELGATSRYNNVTTHARSTWASQIIVLVDLHKKNPCTQTPCLQFLLTSTPLLSLRISVREKKSRNSLPGISHVASMYNIRSHTTENKYSNFVTYVLSLGALLLYASLPAIRWNCAFLGPLRACKYRMAAVIRNRTQYWRSLQITLRGWMRRDHQIPLPSPTQFACPWCEHSLYMCLCPRQNSCWLMFLTRISFSLPNWWEFMKLMIWYFRRLATGTCAWFVLDTSLIISPTAYRQIFTLLVGSRSELVPFQLPSASAHRGIMLRKKGFEQSPPQVETQWILLSKIFLWRSSAHCFIKVTFAVRKTLNGDYIMLTLHPSNFNTGPWYPLTKSEFPRL